MTFFKPGVGKYISAGFIGVFGVAFLEGEVNHFRDVLDRLRLLEPDGPLVRVMSWATPGGSRAVRWLVTADDPVTEFVAMEKNCSFKGFTRHLVGF